MRLLRRLPKTLTERFAVLVLADTASGSKEFVTQVRRLKHHALVGISCTRKLDDGRNVRLLHKRGSGVRLLGLKFSVYLSWYYFQRSDGKLEKRYILCTKALKGSTIPYWGRRRWAIEGFFKTAKHRFGQQTLLGVYRWLVLSLTAYLLTHWSYLHSPNGPLPDWGEAAQLALELLLPLMALLPLLADIQRLRALAKSYGLDLNATWCKM